MLHKTDHFAIGNAAKLMLCHLMWRTAANTAGATFCVQASEFGLAAMAELVVERPATIFHWDGQSVCQRSWACVTLQVDFGWC